MGLKIIFMGTPDFAVPSLRILVENDYDVVAVVTSTDKMGGRGGKQLLQSAVKQYALANDIKVLQPKNLKAPEFNEQLKLLDADLQVVVAFRMLPEMVWNMPPLGTINLHGSLLPKFRGAAPINWAIIKGESQTGVTSFKLKHEIDTGDMIFQESIPIGFEDTAGDMHDKMMELGAKVVLKTVQALEKDEVVYKQQGDSPVYKAPKIHHDTCKIDFNDTALNIHNLIRGLSPYPTAWTYFEEGKLKIFKAKPFDEPTGQNPGAILTDEKSYIRICTKDGYIELLEIQLQGRKKMDVKSFLNGYKF